MFVPLPQICVSKDSAPELKVRDISAYWLILQGILIYSVLCALSNSVQVSVPVIFVICGLLSSGASIERLN